MIRRPPRSTLDRSSAASDVYKRQVRLHRVKLLDCIAQLKSSSARSETKDSGSFVAIRVVEGPLVGSEYALCKQENLVGRHSGLNDVSIPESFISRRHCSVYYESGNAYLKDLGSTTGTFVMARKEVELRPGLLLQLGTSEFRVEVEDELMVMEVYEGPAKGEVVIIKEEGIGIGRDSSNYFSVPEDSQMSSFHAAITKKGSTFYIQDEGSTNK
eukprot:TRINITY_DN13517_c0_g1_i3.p1 TRINITY_DN13517_c0_g1~~TRINITY_DN13517_c0_g1_i3.p1  ORF type:complete len:222 (-),score=73.66 TRINITY_DN13517_c0_g1_i3:424-1065(-)